MHVAVEPGQLGDGSRMVVDAQVHPYVPGPAIPAARLHHQQRRALHAAPVPAGGLARRERREEPLGERALLVPRRLVRSCHRLERGAAHQDVPLHGEALSDEVARVVEAALPGERGGVPFASTRPICRSSAPGSPATSRRTTSSAGTPCESSRSASSRQATFASAWVATAPAPARAAGTMAPTAGNFDWTATPI